MKAFYVKYHCFWAVILSLWPQVVGAQSDERSNLWLMWERVHTDPACSGAKDCPDLRDLRSHVMLSVDTPWADGVFQSLRDPASEYGRADLQHDRSLICASGDLGTFDLGGAPPNTAAGVPLSAAVDTLRGLQGIHADFRGLRGPPGYPGNFGREMHLLLSETLDQISLPLISKETYDGDSQGRLSIRYSPEVLGCRPWAIYLSLYQHVTLARDPTVKVDLVTWSTNARQDEDNFDFTPIEAVETVIGKFISDYLEANGVLETASTVEKDP